MAEMRQGSEVESRSKSRRLPNRTMDPEARLRSDIVPSILRKLARPVSTTACSPTSQRTRETARKTKEVANLFSTKKFTSTALLQNVLSPGLISIERYSFALTEETGIS
jgi:hypothetical protein